MTTKLDNRTRTSGRPFRILAINGGGTLGLMPALVLQHLEQKTGKRIHEMFDLICGTSVGAVIAGVCVTPKNMSGSREVSAQVSTTLPEAIEELKSTKMFHTSWWRDMYTLGGLLAARVSPKKRDDIMQKLYGNTKITDGLTDILTVSYDISSNNAKIFSSSKGRANLDDDVLISDAIKASAAVPTVWDPLRVGSSVCIDGGLFSNNPLLYGLSEAINVYNAEPEDIILFSLGTGYLVDSDPQLFTRGFRFLEKVVRTFASSETINSVTLANTFLPKISQFVHLDFPLQWNQFKVLSTSNKTIATYERVANGVVQDSDNVLTVLGDYLTGNAPLESHREEKGQFYTNVHRNFDIAPRF